MTEKSHPKKKIYQIAKEINISHETLMEYLKKRGHEVKSHMSLVDDLMMHDILSHFKKDKEVADKHQKKIQTIRDAKKKADTKTSEQLEVQKSKLIKRKKVTETKEEPVTPIAETTIVETVPTQIAIPVEVPLSEDQKIKQEETSADVGILSEQRVESTSEVSEAAEVTEVLEEEILTTEEIIPQSPAPAEEGPKEVVKEKKTHEIMRRLTPKMGLKIKGKIDLAEVKRTTDILEGTTKPEQEAASKTDEAKKKKKKKKRIKAEPAVVVKEKEEDELLRKAKKKRKLKYREVDQEEVDEAIKRTLAEMDESAPVITRASFKKKRKEKRLIEEQRQRDEQALEASILRVTEFVSVSELSNLMGVSVADVIKKCIELGIMVSINQRLDKDTITLVADEFGFEVKFFSELTEDAVVDIPDEEAELEPRPPVVTIMGHVDHGKTSLLDYIRQANVVAGEAGGITQHIGAYMVSLSETKSITFLDTPGHEAFTAMRARGAQLTDIVVLVVAADDNVMPQTVEAISHSQAANVPIIIAINKMDKADANADRIRQQLSDKNVLIEEWGGKYQCVELSARTGKNVDLLLEKIALESDVLNLKANPNREARGAVIEAQVDKGKGTVATILVQKGKLMIGDPFVSGIQSGRVRAMYDERGHRVDSAGPSTPVQVLGFDGVPQAGDSLIVVDSDREAREISLRRQQLKREQDFRLIRSVTLDDLSQKIKDGQIKELKVVVKGDVDGSVGALADSLMKIFHSEVRVSVIHRAVGTITESDVLLAAASGAVIIGFHVRPNINARRLAEQENVDIRLYNIIYDAIDDVKKALEGLLAPEKKEEITATIEVRDIFKVPKMGTIAGCFVQDGKIARGNKVRLVRDGIVMFEGGLSSLKRFKDDVREVESGFECGIGLDGFNDIKVGDIIEGYKVVETMRKLGA
ncbi:MAG: translation initiation factor IF-2 [Ignavibacteriales bacterium]|nr:translation initiation factor IF-2 [Ignavibacteriales bacterium]